MTIIPKHLAIRSVAGTGSGLFTNLAIQPGSEILNVDRPLVSVLNSGHLKTACTNCFLWMPDNGVDGNAVVQTETGIADEKKLKACQGCKIVRYCSKVGCLSFATYDHRICYFSVCENIIDLHSPNILGYNV